MLLLSSVWKIVEASYLTMSFFRLHNTTDLKICVAVNVLIVHSFPGNLPQQKTSEISCRTTAVPGIFSSKGRVSMVRPSKSPSSNERHFRKAMDDFLPCSLRSHVYMIFVTPHVATWRTYGTNPMQMCCLKVNCNWLVYYAKACMNVFLDILNHWKAWNSLLSSS